MIKRIALAAAIVLLTNGVTLLIAARNTAGNPDATVTVTERELRVAGTPSDNTGMSLLLSWNRQAPQQWFTREKLSALGFDCSVDPNSSRAWAHYDLASLPRAVYVVLEYDPDRIVAVSPVAVRVQQPGEMPNASPTRTPEYESRLRAIDVGNDRDALRGKYADRSRFIITQGIVQPRLLRASPRDPLRLEGWLTALLPSEVYVPRDMQATIASAVGKSDRRGGWPLTGPPRYEVTLQYGRSLLPRVVGVRRTTPRP